MEAARAAAAARREETAHASEEVVTDDQFALLLTELRAIRAAVERAPASFDRRAELLAAIADYFGADAPFTVSGLLSIADDDPRSPIASTLAKVIDLSAPGRAVSLGRLLASIDALERVQRSGVLLYRLASDAD